MSRQSQTSLIFTKKVLALRLVIDVMPVLAKKNGAEAPLY
jgi:hypothetical protein